MVDCFSVVSKKKSIFFFTFLNWEKQTWYWRKKVAIWNAAKIQHLETGRKFPDNVFKPGYILIQHGFVCLCWCLTSQSTICCFSLVVVPVLSIWLSVLLKDTRQWLRWDLNLRPLDLEISTLVIYHWAPPSSGLAWKGHRSMKLGPVSLI